MLLKIMLLHNRRKLNKLRQLSNQKSKENSLIIGNHQ